MYASDAAVVRELADDPLRPSDGLGDGDRTADASPT